MPLARRGPLRAGDQSGRGEPGEQPGGERCPGKGEREGGLEPEREGGREGKGRTVQAVRAALCAEAEQVIPRALELRSRAWQVMDAGAGPGPGHCGPSAAGG